MFEIDKNPVACVALHIYPEQNKGELACLYVNPSHENQGIGRKLIQFIESKARELGLNELITLSTQAFTYFQSKGGFVGRHAGRSAARSAREIRPERTQFQGAGEEVKVVTHNQVGRSRRERRFSAVSARQPYLTALPNPHRCRLSALRCWLTLAL